MSIYRERILPRLLDKIMDRPSSHVARDQVCAGLYGEVLEIGFGTGLNISHYPNEVKRVCAIEPSELGWEIAEPRIAARSIPIEMGGLNGERLALTEEQFDCALSTWTLCSIPDVSLALKEIHRVLKPGGELHYLEHGHAPDESVARWQSRIEPVQKIIAGGCHLTRPIADLITEADFTIVESAEYYSPKEPKPFGYTFIGRAQRN